MSANVLPNPEKNSAKEQLSSFYTSPSSSDQIYTLDQNSYESILNSSSANLNTNSSNACMNLELNNDALMSKKYQNSYLNQPGYYSDSAVKTSNSSSHNPQMHASYLANFSTSSLVQYDQVNNENINNNGNNAISAKYFPDLNNNLQFQTGIENIPENLYQIDPCQFNTNNNMGSLEHYYYHNVASQHENGLSINNSQFNDYTFNNQNFYQN